MAAAATPTHSGADVLPLVVCRVCERPLRTARSRAQRLGEGCRRKLQAALRRRFHQLTLPLPATASARQHQLDLDQITSADDRLEARVNDTVQRPDPRQPHDYQADDALATAKDWRGDPAVPCLCTLPQQHAIHQPNAVPTDRSGRPRRPRAPSARQQQDAAEWAAHDRARLGERDDD